MTQQDFKQTFLASWLAAWSVNRYNDDCMTGEHPELIDFPIEDAQELADRAWEAYSKLAKW